MLNRGERKEEKGRAKQLTGLKREEKEGVTGEKKGEREGGERG